MTQDIHPAHENLLDLRNLPPKKPNRKNRKLSSNVYTRSLIIVSVIIITLLTIFLLHKKEDLNSVKVITGKVSKLMILPAHEEPALATITDTSRLTTPFLKKAKNGDKLLVYQDAQRVIIYRPSINRIVDVGPVSIAGPSSQ